MSFVFRVILRMAVNKMYRALALLMCITFALAQFPPEPEGITVLRSRFDNGVTISYKEVQPSPEHEVIWKSSLTSFQERHLRNNTWRTLVLRVRMVMVATLLRPLSSHRDLISNFS